MFRFIWYWFKVITLIVLGAFTVWLGYEFFTFPDIAALKTENPTTTSMIEYRISQWHKKKEDLQSELKSLQTRKGERYPDESADRIKIVQSEIDLLGREPKREQIWVPINRISPHLQKAVIAGEDTNFVAHDGFDWDAIQKAWEAAQKEAEKEAKAEGDKDPNDWEIPNLDKDSLIDAALVSLGYPKTSNFKRGASTITQQLSKNLYLSEERSFTRKVREYLITRSLESNLSKRRILEIYLNVIEWGDGIYGAEAASRVYFKKSAAELTPQEAAYLAAMIPSPLNIFNPQKNPKRVTRRQRVLLRGMPHVKIPN